MSAAALTDSIIPGRSPRLVGPHRYSRHANTRRISDRTAGDGIRIGFAYAAFTKDWGHGNHAADTRFFAIDYDDFRHILKTDNVCARPPCVKGDTGEHSHSDLGRAQRTRFDDERGDVRCPGLGSSCSDGPLGNTNPAFLYAFDLETGYQPAILPALKPWIRPSFGYTLGSGDGQSQWYNKHETFFQILPTPRPYAMFPFFNMMNTRGCLRGH